MATTNRFFLPQCIQLVLLLPVLLSGLYGCASSPAASGAKQTQSAYLSGKTDTGGSETVSPAAVVGSGGTVLAVPTRDQLKKNDLDKSVLALLEKGSPESLRSAVSMINQDTRGMTDQNRIALALAFELMKILYPLETVSWSEPSVPETNAYIGALRSARKGVYDYSAGSADFLSLVLPSLVLSTITTAGDYYKDAEDSLSKAYGINPDSVLVLHLLALLAERQGNLSVAGGYYKQAWLLDSSCYPAGIGYCRFLIASANSSLALQVAQALTIRYPSSREITRLAAEAAFSTRDWAAADQYVLAALKAEPNDTTFLLMRVRILVERKDYLKANSLLDAFATTNRTNRDYLLLRSRVISEWNKNLVSAITILQEAQKLYPDDSEVLLASAQICYQSGQSINGLGGRDFVSLVLTKDGGNRLALSLLTEDYLDANDWTNAIKYGELLVSLYPAEDTRSLLLRSYIGASQSSRAVALARGMYNPPESSDELTSLYLQALIASGDTKTASSILSSRMAGASPALKSILYYHESTIRTDPDERLSSLRSSLLSDPRNVRSLFSMYGWYMDKKDYRKAQYYLKQVIALDPMNKTYVRLLSSLDDLLAR